MEASRFLSAREPSAGFRLSPLRLPRAIRHDSKVEKDFHQLGIENMEGDLLRAAIHP